MNLVAMPARTVLALLRSGELTAAEVHEAVATRLAAVEPLINAVPLRVSHPAAGLPITVKDVLDVAGLPTTFGSLCSAYPYAPPPPALCSEHPEASPTAAPRAEHPAKSPTAARRSEHPAKSPTAAPRSELAGAPPTSTLCSEHIYASPELCSPYSYAAPHGWGVARTSDPLVRRLESHGMAVIGKTNVPEFLSGAETTNDLFGPTRNPWDPALTCGASSGGAAASVASGTSWLAHGEDTAGSIRIPAAFCGVVGLRTTPGLIPTAPTADPVPGFTVHGPIARDVDDALLMLQAMSPSPLIGSPSAPAGSPTGPAPTRLPLPTGTPLTGTPPLTSPSPSASPPSGSPLRRIGYSPDLGGRVPIDPSIAAVCAQLVAALGDRVSLAEPAVDGWHEACLVLLAHRAAVLHGPRVDRFGDRLGAGVRAEVEAGRSLTPVQLAGAWEVHAAARDSARRGLFDTHAAARDTARPELHGGRSTARDDARPGLFDGHDVIVTPAFGVLPWRPPADLATVAASWPLMTVATMAGCPALVVPCGVTEGGLPVALQLIGPPGSDIALLHLGREIEQLRTMPDLPLSRVPTPL